MSNSRVLFEVAGVTREVAEEALRLAAHKLPIETKFVAKQTAADIAATLPGAGRKEEDASSSESE